MTPRFLIGGLLTLVFAAVAAGGVMLVRDDDAGTNSAELEDLYDPIVAGEDFPGGIRWVKNRDGIRPIYEPGFVPADESGLSGEALVIGVDLEGEVKAYPVGLLAAREIVNDWVGDVPILVSWCPLCGTGTVHRRLIDDRPVLFGNQGALWGNAMTWFDHDTGSIWSQPLGEAIAGPLERTRLDLLPATLTSWANWQDNHPSTLVLAGPIYEAGTSITETAVVVERRNEAAAYPMATLVVERVINDEVGGERIAVVAATDTSDGWAVFSTTVGTLDLTLVTAGQFLMDLETGTRWDPVTGKAVDGPLTGESMAPLPASTVFPKDFETFWPEGTIYEGLGP